MLNVLSFSIYIFAGFATGWQIFQLIMWGIWGAPTSLIQFVGLLGAWGLDLAGGLAFKKKKASLVSAAAGLVALWSFYIPALYQTLHPTQATIAEPSAFFAPALLGVATVYYALDLILYLKLTKEI